MLTRISLPWRIGLLVAGTTLPLILFAAGVVYQSHVARAEAAHDRVLALVRSTLAVLDSETQRITASLRVLAQSNELARDDFEGFRRIAEEFVAQFGEGASLVLGDRSGTILFDTLPNRPTTRTDRAGRNEVFRTGQPDYSPVFVGNLSGRLILTITVPVRREGETVYALSINPPLSMFQRLLERQRPDPDWTFSLFDQNGVNFARLPNPQETVGRRASPTLYAQMFQSREAKIKTHSLESVPLLTAFTRSQISGWTVAAGIDEHTLIAPLQRNLMATATIGILLLFVGLGFAIRLGTQLARAEAVQALLVDELNHRIKNVLSTVQALAMQTFRGVRDAGPATKVFAQRVAALARANALLSVEKWQSADIGALVDSIREPLGPALARRLHAAGPPAALAPQAAMLISMVLHELATNAMKYGALSNETGEVDLNWKTIGTAKGRTLDLCWSERGGPPVEVSDRKGFGMTLIQRGFSDQLGGSARIEFSRDGIRCHLECRLTSPHPQDDRGGDVG